jgi:rare lipoprotein A
MTANNGRFKGDNMSGYPKGADTTFHTFILTSPGAMRGFAGLLVMIGVAILAGCATTPRQAPERETAEIGLASYYADRFQGRRTASGERYDRHAFTAAHRRLKFGTLVHVTCLDNGRSVTVRINDRGPYVKGRIIDLSRAAAETLGMLQAGVVKVRIVPAE